LILRTALGSPDALPSTGSTAGSTTTYRPAASSKDRTRPVLPLWCAAVTNPRTSTAVLEVKTGPPRRRAAASTCPRGAVLGVAKAGVSAGVQQEAENRRVPRVSGERQGAVPPAVEGVGRCSGGEQQSNDIGVPAAGRAVECAASLRVHYRHVSVPCQEGGDAGGMPIPRGAEEGGGPAEALLWVIRVVASVKARVQGLEVASVSDVAEGVCHFVGQPVYPCLTVCHLSHVLAAIFTPHVGVH